MFIRLSRDMKSGIYNGTYLKNILVYEHAWK